MTKQVACLVNHNSKFSLDKMGCKGESNRELEGHHQLELPGYGCNDLPDSDKSTSDAKTTTKRRKTTTRKPRNEVITLVVEQASFFGANGRTNIRIYNNSYLLNNPARR